VIIIIEERTYMYHQLYYTCTTKRVYSQNPQLIHSIVIAYSYTCTYILNITRA